MLTQLNKWISGGSSGGVEEQRLREISLEYPEAELVSATNSFDPARRLGSGNYGCVYRGTLKDGHEVAIKVIEVDEEDTSGFADEVLVLSKFRHPNLVTLMGWGTGTDEDGCGRKFLVYELLEGGDVAGRLAKCRAPRNSQAFSWVERLWVALDAACGLSHMHNSTPKAFHRDIKSANILLDRSGTAKMADFGLSGIAKNKNKLNMTCDQISGTPGYACPHYIKTGKVTEQTEVYAYGMVVMEMLLNSMPAAMGQNGNIVYPIFQIVMPQSDGALERAVAAVDKGAEWPPGAARDVAELSLVCAAHEEKRRPKFTDVGKRLRELCQEHCEGKRPAAGGYSAAATRPQIGQGAAGATTPQVLHAPGAPGATAPQMGPGGMGMATNPQMGPGVGPPASAATATKPQMVAGLGPGSMATNPQMGIGAGGAGSLATKPQMGFGGGGGQGEVATKPQLGLGPCGGGELATKPQIQMGLGESGGGEIATRPQLGLGAGCGGSAAPTQPQIGQATPSASSSFFEVLSRLFDTGVATEDERKEARESEVLLECTYSSGVDLSQLPLKQKCLPLRGGDGPWAVGRQMQPNFFAQLIPDEATRTLISRSHVVISLNSEGRALRLKKLSPNTVKVNGQNVPKEEEVTLPPAATVEFCGRDNQTPILSFAILLRDPTAPMPDAAAPTKPQLSATPEQPSRWWCSKDPGPFFLICVSAIGMDVSQMPPEARTVPLDSAQKLMLGRLHQSGLFEQLLSAELAQRYLCCVSRSHLEIVPSSPQGSFEVTNLSANPIAISGPKLGKGERATLRPGTCIDFIGTHSDGSGQTVVYLKLKLESRDQPRAQREYSGGARSPEKPPTEPLLEALGGAEGKRATEVGARKGSAPFYLELGGSAVRQTFPDSQRILEGSADGLLVGRAHQQSLHQEAFRKEVREYLSRDHFRIDRDREGQFNLVALSANPIWRMRQRQLRELERGDPPLSLLHGDEIFVFTGATDCTPDGPDNLGVLKWRFVQPGDRSMHDPVVENDTIRSMRRPSQQQAESRGRHPGHPLAGSLIEKEKNRYMCLPQVFDWGDDMPRSQRKSRSPQRVSFKTDQDERPRSLQRPATGYIRQTPPEAHDIYGPDGRRLDSQLASYR